MQKTSIAFIVNPLSGTDRVKALENLIFENLDKNIFEIEIVFTKYAGHATLLSKELAQKNTNIIVAVGGDGTVNEVASALVNSKSILAILPKGSGNGLARACKIPLNTSKALQIILKQDSIKIDVGFANEKYFFSNTGVGFDAFVSKQCKNEKNRGIKMYLQKSIQAFINYQPENYLIEIDEKTYNTKAFMISIANGNEFGYGFKIAPTASLSDGLLDIMIIEPLTLLTATTVSFNAWKGNIHQHSKVTHLQGKSIKINNNLMDCFQIDGDAVELNKNLEIKILPKALNIFVP